MHTYVRSKWMTLDQTSMMEVIAKIINDHCVTTAYSARMRENTDQNNSE